MGFHQNTINKLVNRLMLKNKYIYVLHEVPYSKSEIDVLAYRDRGKRNYLLVFEVKSKNEYKYKYKALKQLNLHEDTFGNTVNKMYKFYVCPEHRNKKKYNLSWIK